MNGQFPIKGNGQIVRTALRSALAQLYSLHHV